MDEKNICADRFFTMDSLAPLPTRGGRLEGIRAPRIASSRLAACRLQLGERSSHDRHTVKLLALDDAHSSLLAVDLRKLGETI